MDSSSEDDILAIDVGATSIKSAVVDGEGNRRHSIRKRKTPRPLGPGELRDILIDRIGREVPRRVVVGVPLECLNGVIKAGGNLSRRGAVNSENDSELEIEWREFPLEKELKAATGREVVVLNDAILAAVGCASANGKELVLTLGTGFGVALLDAGIVQSIPDHGELLFLDGTFDSVLGEGARVVDSSLWLNNLKTAIAQLSQSFAADVVRLAGGNAKRLNTRDLKGLGVEINIEGNEAPFRGAAVVLRNSKVIGR